MLSPSVSLTKCDELNVSAVEVPPEASPWWPLVLILGEIAERIERHQAKEHAVDEGP